MSSQKKVSSEQKNIMIGFLKENPEMYMGRFAPQFTKSKSKDLWEELTIILNSVPNGAAKDWCGWRKSWIDVKKYSKSKFAAVKKYQCSTVGGPPMKPPKSNDFDEQIFEMITQVAATGNDNIPEPTIEDDAMEDPDTELEMEDTCLVDETEQIEDLNQQTPKKTPALQTEKKNTQLPTTSASKWFGTERVTKSMRLTESIKTNKEFLKLNTDGVQDTKTYHNQKVKYYNEKLQMKKKYYENKVRIAEKQTEAIECIGVALKRIADNLEELF